MLCGCRLVVDHVLSKDNELVFLGIIKAKRFKVKILPIVLSDPSTNFGIYSFTAAATMPPMDEKWVVFEPQTKPPPLLPTLFCVSQQVINNQNASVEWFDGKANTNEGQYSVNFWVRFPSEGCSRWPMATFTFRDHPSEEFHLNRIRKRAAIVR